MATKKRPKAVGNGSDGLAENVRPGRSCIDVDAGVFGIVRRADSNRGEVRKPVEWRAQLADLELSEAETVELESKHTVWLDMVPAFWGTFLTYRIDAAGTRLLVRAKDDSLVAVLAGQGRTAKLHVSTETHWERLSSVQLGPGLDWANKKSWDVRCREEDLPEVARNGKLTSMRRLSGALAIGNYKASGRGWTELEDDE